MNAMPMLLAPLVFLIAKPDTVVQPTGWTGKTVLLKRTGIKILKVDDAGNQVDLGELTELDYKVFGDVGGRIQVKNRQGIDGWIDKTDAVVLDDAVLYFTNKIQQDAQDSDAYNRRAWAWKLKGELDIAIKDFGESLRLNPDAAIYNNRGATYHAKGDYDKAAGDYSEAIRLNPNFVLPYFNRALLRETKKEYDKAIEDYTEAIRIDNKYVNAFRNRGYMQHLKKEYAKAIEDFNEAIRLDPRGVDAINDRGNSYHELKEYDKAIADFTSILKIDPKFFYATYNRARAHDAKKEYEKAVDDYSETIRQNPRYYFAYWGRAATRTRLKDYVKAASDYNEAIKIEPKNASLLNSAAWLMATAPDEKARDGKRAIELAKKAVELSKNGANALDTLAAAYAEAGDFDMAVRYQEDALRNPAFENNKAFRDRLELYKKKTPYRQPE